MSTYHPLTATLATSIFALSNSFASTQTCSQNTVTPFTAQDGHSSAPELSYDGRYTVFVSNSKFLSPADTNGNLPSVFRYDRLTNTLVMFDLSYLGFGPANSASQNPAISGDGDIAVFTTGGATQMAMSVSTNGVTQVYAHDFTSGSTTCVSLANNSTSLAGNAHSGAASVSQIGDFVAFESPATNLGPIVPSGVRQIYLRNRLKDTTQLISVDSQGIPANAECGHPSISADGRYVAFDTLASLHPADQNSVRDVYVRDTLLNVTHLISRTESGAAGNKDSRAPSIARFATKVAFGSEAQLTSIDTNTYEDVYVVDFSISNPSLAIQPISIEYSNSSTANHSSYDCSISGDGRYVAYRSESTNLDPDWYNTFPWGTSHIYVRDTQIQPNNGGNKLQTLTCAGHPTAPLPSLNTGNSEPSISWNGKVVSFISIKDDFVCSPEFPGTANYYDVFVRDKDMCGNPASTTVYGPCKGGSIGCPIISAVGQPIPGQISGFQVTNGRPGAIPYLFIGFEPSNLKWCGNQATLLVNISDIRILPPFPASGTLIAAGPLTNDPSTCGIATYTQVYFQDPTASCYYHLSHTAGLCQVIGH